MEQRHLLSAEQGTLVMAIYDRGQRLMDEHQKAVNSLVTMIVQSLGLTSDDSTKYTIQQERNGSFVLVQTFAGDKDEG